MLTSPTSTVNPHVCDRAAWKRRREAVRRSEPLHDGRRDSHGRRRPYDYTAPDVPLPAQTQRPATAPEPEVAPEHAIELLRGLWKRTEDAYDRAAISLAATSILEVCQ